MICSTSHVQLPTGTATTSSNSTASSSRKRNLPTPPPSFTDVNDSSSSSSSSSSCSSYSSSPTDESHSPVSSCDLLNLLTDARFRPVFQAIEEIKRRKCRPDLERILKYVEKRSKQNHLIYQREQIVQMLDDLLKYGLISKVFHKGGFTIRIKQDQYSKFVEHLSQSSKVSHTPIRESPSPEFAESSPICHLTQENKKRHRTATPSGTTKRSRATESAPLPTVAVAPSTSHFPPSTPIEPVFRKPFLINTNLPPVTIEQLLGLRGDIPDVHDWTTEDLIAFFHQQGYEYAEHLLLQYQINGNQLYQLKREDLFRMSTMKIGKSLKFWNVIEQIQRNNPLSSSNK